MDSWRSYPKVFALGHRALDGLLDGPVIVQEKIDGSQFSFGKDEDGKIHVRSKGREFDIEAPDSMFVKACETVKAIADKLELGWTYRGEYLQKPKHNALAYDRTPKRHIILFDINDGNERYVPYSALASHAAHLGLEAVPVLTQMEVTPAVLLELLETPSILGGQTVEGVVVKPSNYDRFGLDGKLLIGKYVSERFKEVNHKAWRKDNPTSGDILMRLQAAYCSEARWRKAMQHLAESGLLLGDPEDIGPLVKEAERDTRLECEEEIKEQLFKWAWPHIKRSVTRGLPEWYKRHLLTQTS